MTYPFLSEDALHQYLSQIIAKIFTIFGKIRGQAKTGSAIQPSLLKNKDRQNCHIGT